MPFQISDSCTQLAVTDRCLSLCYRFILLVENNPKLIMVNNGNNGIMVLMGKEAESADRG